MTIEYIWGGFLFEYFVNYENVTNISYGCGSQNHNLMLAHLTLKV